MYSSICYYIQLVATSHSLWKTPLYNSGRMKMGKLNNVSAYEYSFDLTNKLKRSWGLPGGRGPHFKKHCKRLPWQSSG